MKKGFVYIIAFCFAGFASVKGNAQTNNNDTIRVEAFITPEGDTIPQSWLPTVEVIAKQTALWKNYWRNWTRLKNAVYVTYPYAKTASKLINEVNSQLANVSDEGQRKKINKSSLSTLVKIFESNQTIAIIEFLKIV